ncbi:hypothetical protein, partial [Microcystis sp.]|uniref:hypothetical protein n=1 Tax=Microcystis sp. TaxID=1127 RepID=UPI00391A17F2
PLFPFLAGNRWYRVPLILISEKVYELFWRHSAPNQHPRLGLGSMDRVGVEQVGRKKLVK